MSDSPDRIEQLKRHYLRYFYEYDWRVWQVLSDEQRRQYVEMRRSQGLLYVLTEPPAEDNRE